MSSIRDRFASVLSATTPMPAGVVPSFVSSDVMTAIPVVTAVAPVAAVTAAVATVVPQPQMTAPALPQGPPPFATCVVVKKSFFQSRKNILILVVFAIGVAALGLMIYHRRNKQAKSLKKKMCKSKCADDDDDDGGDQGDDDDTKDAEDDVHNDDECGIPGPVASSKIEDGDCDSGATSDEQQKPQSPQHHPVAAGVTLLPPPTPLVSTQAQSQVPIEAKMQSPHRVPEPPALPLYKAKATSSSIPSEPKPINLAQDAKDPNFTRFM